MKTTLAFSAALAAAFLLRADYAPEKWNLEARDKFAAQRFGIFIHWGIYANYAQGEWYQQNIGIDTETYGRMMDGFYPSKFDAKEWVRVFKDAGAKYVTITSRHHDGFSLWPTKVDDGYNIANTPFKRDILAIMPKAESKNANNDTQIFEIGDVQSDKERHASFAKNAIMMLVVATFVIAVAISLFTFNRSDQMHVIAHNTHLYAADSTGARQIDNLNYGETIRISSDKPESTDKNGVVWVEAVSLRGIKGYVPKTHIATAKIYQQFNSIFTNKEAIELVPNAYRQTLWKYFVSNKYFKNSVSLWEISAETGNSLAYNGIATGDFDGNLTTDFACVFHSTSDRTCKVLIFFDNNSASSVDFASEVKIHTILKGEAGGGWFLGNVYTRTMSNGSHYEVNKYEFLGNDGILILDIESEINSVCYYNLEENKIHLMPQPK